MKIAVVHSYYSSEQPSGENVAVDEQLKLLSQAGHHVRLIALRTDALRQKALYAIRAGMTVASGHGPSPMRELADFKPDIVHVHNLFPNWGTSWLGSWRGPLVATQHNYRSVCAVGTLYRDGSTCYDCVSSGSWSAVRHGCYHDSRLQSVPLALRNRRGVQGDHVIGGADRVIALGQGMFDFLHIQGVPREKLALIPNFSRQPVPPQDNAGTGDGMWLYVGRLSAEKGLIEMLTGWPVGQPLLVLGDGPLRNKVRALLPPGSRLMGQVSQEDVLACMSQSNGLVFPGRCIESATPLVVVEAFSSGLPVVALAGSEPAIQITQKGGGLVVGSPGSWDTALSQILRHQEEFSIAARQVYEDLFTPERWLEAITSLYASITEEART